MKPTQEEVHALAVKNGFWSNNPNLGEKLALVHSEVSEALEELRRPEPDKGKFGDELADIVIRVMDIAGWIGIDLDAAIWSKHERNVRRPFKHGKRF